MKALTQAMALVAHAGRPLKRTLDLFTIRLLRAVAAKCRARAAGGSLRATTA